MLSAQIQLVDVSGIIHGMKTNTYLSAQSCLSPAKYPSPGKLSTHTFISDLSIH